MAAATHSYSAQLQQKVKHYCARVSDSDEDAHECKLARNQPKFDLQVGSLHLLNNLVRSRTISRDLTIFSRHLTISHISRPLATSHSRSLCARACLVVVVSQLCTACPVPPGGVKRWPTSQKAGCSGWHHTNCKWGGVCSRGNVYNGCGGRTLARGCNIHVCAPEPPCLICRLRVRGCWRGGRDRCIEHVFGHGIKPYIALEGCSALNQQWIVRNGVVGSLLYE